MSSTIRPATLADAPAAARIYNHYILNTVSTFETEPLDNRSMEARITAIVPQFPFLVLEQDSDILGYCYAAAYKQRAAFFRSCELSIYMQHEHTGRGYGAELYRELLHRLPDYDLHSGVAGISLPNPPSEALHLAMGFRHIGVMREIGFKFGHYIDVAYYQYLVTQHPDTDRGE